MTPARVLAVVLILLFGATLAVGMWGEQPSRQRTPDDYISIALSQPEIFHAGVPRQTTVHPGNPVIVDFVFDNARGYRVYIDPKTDRVTRVERY